MLKIADIFNNIERINPEKESTDKESTEQKLTQEVVTRRLEKIGNIIIQGTTTVPPI